MPRRHAARHRSFGLSLFAGVLGLATTTSLLAEPAPAPAQVPTRTYTITLDASPTAPGRLKIRGTWPNACLPAFENASLRGDDLTITARTTLTLCDDKPTPVALSVNPAFALGLPSLPAGVYHVWFRAADSAHAAATLRAFAVVDAGTPARSTISPETGFWWPVSGAASAIGRNVMSLEFQGAQLSAAVLGYGEDGRSNWQFGTSAFDGRLAHVPLLQLAGNEPSAGDLPGRRGEAGLVLDLQFHSNSHATAWLSRTLESGLDVQAVDLVRLPFADVSDGAAWQGEWILVADDDSAPQRLRLRAAAAAADNRFVLGDAHSGVTVDCVYDPENSDLPAQNCTVAQRDGKILAKLDEVAITRMDGKRPDGVTMHLLRVTQ